MENRKFNVGNGEVIPLNEISINLGEQLSSTGTHGRDTVHAAYGRFYVICENSHNEDCYDAYEVKPSDGIFEITNSRKLRAFEITNCDEVGFDNAEIENMGDVVIIGYYFTD